LTALLKSLAWPEQEGTAVTKENAIDSFSDAMDDERIRTEILMQGTKTPVEALKLAVHMEAITQRPRYDRCF